MGRSRFPSHIGLHSNIVWNCTNLYTKKNRSAARADRAPLTSAPARSFQEAESLGPSPSGGFRSYQPVWVRVFSFPSVFSPAFVCPLFRFEPLQHTCCRFGNLQVFNVEICRGVGVWSTGNAWGMENSLQNLHFFRFPPPPRACRHHRVPLLIFSTLIFCLTSTCNEN